MTISKHYYDRDSMQAPGQNGFDIVAHAVDDLPNITRYIMVSLDTVTITGYLEGNSTDIHTTFGLAAGVMHKLAFKRITAVTGGTAKGYN